MVDRRKDIPLFETGFEGSADTGAQLCDHVGCRAEASYRAPKSKDGDDGFFWFCLDHIRTYNSAWDFFADWSESEIEQFRRESVTGHRPTWKFGQHDRPWAAMRINDPFDLWPEDGPSAGAKSTQPLPEKQRQALAILNLDGTASLQEIKMRYKQLVKRFHPDVNGGDKKAEESFKTVREAYDHLLTCGYY